MSTLLLSANEAIALACEYADVVLATGYPGTPSTEIIETISKKSLKIKTQWSINEKVALEVAIGSCIFGKRSIVTMKHVGLNVAADPLMTFSYTGVNAGCVIVTCDDPGMYSSQNEQDNRQYARFSKIPMLEPSDSQEAFDFLLESFKISENFDTPVLLRLSTRVCHGKSTVNIKYTEREQVKVKPYRKQEKYLMLPSISRQRHIFVENRLNDLEQYNSENSLNLFEENKKKDDLLIVTSGISYQYIKESLPEYSVFKIGFSYPQPNEDIMGIAKSKNYKNIICIEELDPFIEENLSSSTFFLKNDIGLLKRDKEFYCGELSPDRVKNIIPHLKDKNYDLQSAEVLKIYETTSNTEAKPNPPKLCSGCPHLTIANLLRQMGVKVSGDIGCYTLAALEPFSGIDIVVDMGASIPMMTGALLSSASDDNDNQEIKNQENNSINEFDSKVISVIGDSTFLHSGITGLLNAKKHLNKGVVCLLDNSTTAMTGRQEHPGIGINQATTDNKIDYVNLVKALGITSVYSVDPYDIEHCEMILKKALSEEELTFIIFSRGCALLTKHKEEQVQVNNNCVKCGECLSVGCPSISFDKNLNRPQINEDSCIGCNICLDACDYDALKKKSNHSISFLV